MGDILVGLRACKYIISPVSFVGWARDMLVGSADVTNASRNL